LFEKLVFDGNGSQMFERDPATGPAYKGDLDLIFAGTDGAPLRPNSISSSVSPLFRRLKIPKPKGAALHRFRHSHGSHLLAAGMELPAVSERLGHSSVMVG
jgi:site-specific recombinase XerD